MIRAARRIYSIKPQGEERPEAWLDALRERVDMLRGFVSLCDSAGRRREGRRKGG